MLTILIYTLGLIVILLYFIAIGFLLYVIIFNHLEKAKKDIKIKNNVLSCAYFFMDMGPSISSVALVALVIMPKDVTTVQLLLVFSFGIILKRVGRVFISSYIKVLKIRQTTNYNNKLFTEMRNK